MQYVGPTLSTVLPYPPPSAFVKRILLRIASPHPPSSAFVWKSSLRILLRTGVPFESPIDEQSPGRLRL